VHAIGFSLGGQAAGLVGKLLKNNGKILNRVTGKQKSQFYHARLSQDSHNIHNSPPSKLPRIISFTEHLFKYLL